MSRLTMPIMGSALLSEIPWGFIAPHESQAQRNHSQSLERLAQRGGLAACEALDIVEGRRWGSAKPCIENERYLINLVRVWRAGQVTPSPVDIVVRLRAIAGTNDIYGLHAPIELEAAAEIERLRLGGKP